MEKTKEQLHEERVQLLNKIREYELAGRFDEDIMDDPPAPVLMPEDIDYMNRSLKYRFKARLAVELARIVIKKLERNNQFKIDEFRGIENFRNLDSGAIITCNHFNPFDSFAIHLTYEASKQRRRTFYRVIKEGNYTNFGGFYGFLMRNCNTLPLSSNMETMKKFFTSTIKILKNGDFVLVYPEQSMWWNYRKPRPLKKGSFVFACKANVPVLPCFITMKDSEHMDEAGFPVQEYTVHISEPLYPDARLGHRERVEDLMQRNFQVWKDIYEREYKTELSYS